MIEDAINMHFLVNCYPTFQPVNGMFGGILQLPENILQDYPEKKVLYETNNGLVIIYVDGIKTEEIRCPNYAIRCLIMCDIICKSDVHGLSGILVRPLKENGSLAEYVYESFMTPKNSVDHINLNISKKQKILESKLNTAFQNMIAYNEINIVPEIEDGFKVIQEHYIKEFESNE